MNTGVLTIGPETNYPQDNQGNNSFSPFILPYRLGSGSLRGAQIIQGKNNSLLYLGNIPASTDFGIHLAVSNTSGSMTMDATQNAFYVTGTDGSKVGMGQIPDKSGDFGFFSIDADGFLLYKIVGPTMYWYNKSYQTNIGQAGLLPDGNYAWIFVPPANNVKDAFS